MANKTWKKYLPGGNPLPGLQAKYKEKIDEFDLSQATSVRKDNIINMDRKSTDVMWKYLLFTFVVLWVCMDTYAYLIGNLYII
jgi:hypothetical protein